MGLFMVEQNYEISLFYFGTSSTEHNSLPSLDFSLYSWKTCGGHKER